jgi:cation transporter-like permease
MLLIVYYLVFVLLGSFVSYLVGLGVESQLGDQASLIVFLTLYFLSLWVAWLLAVRLTEPKKVVQPA